MKNDTLLLIRTHIQSMTKSEQLVAEYVLSHAKEVIYSSVTDVSEKVKVGETTVIRFCRKLGYRGFQDFKLSLAQDMVMIEESTNEEVENDDTFDVLSSKIIRSYNGILNETQKLVQPELYEKAVEYLNKAENIYCFGVGSSGIIAQLAVNSFVRIGKNCVWQTDPHFQAMLAVTMTEKDVAIGISVSGSSKDTVNNMKLAKDSGARIICITQNARSPITQLADIELLMSSRESPLQGSALSSKISQIAVIEILHAGLAIRQGEKAQEYRVKTARAVTDRLI
ncbi:MurR/RpiR family transcriptional regulator [Pseudogracilibacillus auburnensis]|uniref:RpiR family transcriptional regulator n=1 Tax=Pseudogracilibacillus auburnensis TaxID=1494959 RepID=A0A2V3W999_9BACI|nr:MurR/RpiR family transcriptional regulator [Pseudogracilibacillus auburnensis]PXW90106.1 RpiR family transcriptional regulator [Pseudogracilibacillus auburnensis]